MPKRNTRIASQTTRIGWVLGLLVVPLGSFADAGDPVSSAPPSSVTSEPAFSLMTWNLEWFFDDSKRGNCSKLAMEKTAPSRGHWNQRRDAVAEVKPSIVALQEIEGQRVLWYLTRALDRNHALEYEEYAIEGNDRYTEQGVGLLTTPPADVLAIMRGNVTSAMRAAGGFGAVSKHLVALVEIPIGEEIETILIANVHFRSGVAGANIRAKQAASLNRWIEAWEKSASHLIVAGDFNTKEVAGKLTCSPESSSTESWSADPCSKTTHNDAICVCGAFRCGLN